MTELPIDENTPRILIVEDEPKLGQLLIDYLRAASYAPTLISHGDQVLPYVRQTPPDLILLDLIYKKNWRESLLILLAIVLFVLLCFLIAFFF